MNNRRRLVIALGTSALAAPLACFGQPQRSKVARIGLLEPGSAADGLAAPTGNFVMNAARIDEARLFLEEYAVLCRKHCFIVEVMADYATIIDISVPDVIDWDSEQQLQTHIQQVAATVE